MAIIFSDSFGGGNSASVQNRVPELTNGPGTWNNGFAIGVIDGDLYWNSSGNPGQGGYASVGIGANPYGYDAGNTDSGILTLKFTVSSPGNFDDGQRGVSCGVGLTNSSLQNKSVSARLYSGPFSSQWLLLITATGASDFSTPVSVAFGVENTLKILFSPGAYVVSFAGTDYTSAGHGGGYLAGSLTIDDIGSLSRINSFSLDNSIASSATISLTSPAATVAASGRLNTIVALTARAPTLFSTGRDSTGDNDFTYTAPSATLSVHGGVNARLTGPRPALATTATFVGWGKANISAPSATLSAAGTVSGVGQAALTFNTPYKLVGFSGAVASITLTGKYTVQAQSTAGSIGGAAITCPLFELSASGTAQNYGSANLLAPAARLGAQAQAWLTAPGATLTAIGSAVITATYEAYAVNLGHRKPGATDETTRYTNFPFDHVVRYQNSYYGANSTGLYLLEGTTDDGAPIPWAIKTAITDFDSTREKTVVSVYLSGRLGPEATITLQPGEDAVNTYSFTTPRAATIRNHRQKMGRGLDARYFSLGVSGDDTMELDGIEFNVQQKTRRI